MKNNEIKSWTVYNVEGGKKEWNTKKNSFDCKPTKEKQKKNRDIVLEY
jgi:hypothetical protein